MEDEFVKNSKPSDYIKNFNKPPIDMSKDRSEYLYNLGVDNAVIEKVKRLHMKLFSEHPELISEKYATLLAEVQNMRDERKAKDCWYIVVNPKRNIDYKDFKDQCLIARQKSWIVESKLWFEWRGDTFDSIHGNFAIRGNRSPSRVKQEFFNSFKRFIGDDIKHIDNYINIQQSFSDQYKEIGNYQFHPKKYNHDCDMREAFNKKQKEGWKILEDYKYDGRPSDRKKKK